jgi:hypothetical protein
MTPVLIRKSLSEIVKHLDKVRDKGLPEHFARVRDKVAEALAIIDASK